MATASNQFSTSTSIRKIALVIGIGQYADGNDLPNAINDAEDVTEALKRIGFQIDEPKLNLTYDEMEDTLTKFKRSLTDGDLALFYFAGHGIQWEDQNYLIPSDNLKIDGNNLRANAINAQNILKIISLKKPIATIFILDCCRKYHLRNKDLVRHGRATAVNETEGLREMSNEHESLIVFACAAGTIADETETGRNGIFTKHLLRHINSPNEHVQMMLFDVMKGVKEESKSKQIPYLYSSLTNKRLFLNETTIAPEFRPGKHEYCDGRLCAKCGQCRDWYYTGNIEDWHWIQKVKTWKNEDWQRWFNGTYYKSFKKRTDGATCLYRGDGYHHHGLHGYYYHCLCDDNGPK